INGTIGCHWVYEISEKEWKGKEVSIAHLRVFGCDSYVKVKDIARDKLDAKSVKCTFIGYGLLYEWGYRFGIIEFLQVVRSRDVTFNEDSIYGAKTATDSKITQSPGGISDTSEGSENSGSFEDSGRSDEEDCEDRASSKEGGFETQQVRRSTRESRAPVRYSPSANYLLLTENGEPESYSESLNYQQEKRHYIASGCSGLKKSRMAGKGTRLDWLVLSIVASEDLHLEQLDVKTAFLHGDLDEDIYMTQPEGFHSVGKEENLMCKLNKSLYRLKQAPRLCYLKKVGSSSIILLLYVDDMLVAGSDMAEIKKLKRQLSQEYEMKDLGSANQILNMSIIRDKMKGTLRLSQEIYKGEVFKESNDKEIQRRDVEHSVGSVMYAMVCTRPNIAHAVGVVSRFMSNPRREHWEAIKWLLRYLKLHGTIVSWMSRIQKCAAMSATEAEYMAITETGKELKELNFKEDYLRKEPCRYAHQGGDNQRREACASSKLAFRDKLMN
ncbi:putative RNA-directed DNA polymerase, partial [Tanacetum coccineum]